MKARAAQITSASIIPAYVRVAPAEENRHLNASIGFLDAQTSGTPSPGPSVGVGVGVVVVVIVGITPQGKNTMVEGQPFDE